MFFTLIFWVNIETWKKKFATSTDPTLQELFWIKIRAVFMSGLISSFLTYPYDILQTVKIMNIKRQINQNAAEIYRGMFRKYGHNFYLNGLVVRVCRGVSMPVMYFGIYEYFKMIYDIHYK